MKIKPPKTLAQMKPAPALEIPAGQALQALQTLQRMAISDFPAREAYAIARVIARLQANPDLIATDEARRSIARKFGAEKDGVISVPPDKTAAFLAEYEPIASERIALGIPLIPLSILDHAPAMKPADLVTLEPFLDVQ